MLDNEGKMLRILWDWPARGSLYDLIFNSEFQMTKFFQASFLQCIHKGISFLHRSSIRSHGRLSLRTCLISQHWVVKLSQFGVERLAEKWVDKFGPALVQQAPELRERRARFLQPAISEPQPKLPHMGSYLNNSTAVVESMPETDMRDEDWQAADVYALGIVTFELLYKQHFHEILGMETIKATYNNVLNGRSLLPHLATNQSVPHAVRSLLIKCWRIAGSERPSLISIEKCLNSAGLSMSGSLMEQVMHLLEAHNSHLEKTVAERTKSLEEAQQRTDALLCQLLPSSIVNSLKAGISVPARSYDSATVAFADLVNFTGTCARSSPMQIIDFLNDLYTKFDYMLAESTVHKVEVIGDAYMLVSGVPSELPDHAQRMAKLLLEMTRITSLVIVPHLDMPLQLRSGMASGPLAAGIVGLTTPKYCLFGDVVNTAARMEKYSAPQKVLMTERTFKLLATSFNTVYRGEIDIKGKGNMRTYWLGPEVRSDTASSNETLEDPF